MSGQQLSISEPSVKIWEAHFKTVETSRSLWGMMQRGEPEGGTREARVQGPSCWWGSDALEFRTLEPEEAEMRLVRSYGHSSWE